MAYGARRVALLDRMTGAAYRTARVGRLALRLATRTRCGPTDLYAALMAARWAAAHELIERAELATADDPEAELTQIRQPLWFGGLPIYEYEETNR